MQGGFFIFLSSFATSLFLLLLWSGTCNARSMGFDICTGNNAAYRPFPDMLGNVPMTGRSRQLVRRLGILCLSMVVLVFLAYLHLHVPLAGVYVKIKTDGFQFF